MSKTFCTLFLFITLGLGFNLGAMEIPSLTGPVVDEAQFLSRGAHAAISNALMDLNKREGIQFQVLIIDRLLDETIEGYSIKVVDEWKIGKKGDDRAALFLVSLNDKKMRIEVGRGLEGTLTDLTTRRIIEEIKPHFKNQDYDNGVALAVALMARADGKVIKFTKGAVRPRHQRKASSMFVLVALFGLIGFLQMFSGRGRGVSRGGFGGWGGGGFGGGGGGFGGGGGGSWGGGGGGFSGGGSSGSW